MCYDLAWSAECSLVSHTYAVRNAIDGLEHEMLRSTVDLTWVLVAFHNERFDTINIQKKSTSTQPSIYT